MQELQLAQTRSLDICRREGSRAIMDDFGLHISKMSVLNPSWGSLDLFVSGKAAQFTI